MPTRTCIGCRVAREQDELVRVTCGGPDDAPAPEIAVRGRGGRGAWLCPDVDCVSAAGQKRAFSRAFRRKLADPYFADTLLGWLAQQQDSSNP